jgi:NAD(P)-dependent dehydrogenase (short-subunit alcohol dehydrogenase family)
MILQGKIAVVTGASRGIGRAIAEIFAREGATTVICGRRLDGLQAVAAANRHAGELVPMVCNIGRAEEVALFTNAVLERFGDIDILVNNAATNVQQGPCLEADEAQFDKMVDVNLKSAFRLTRAFAPGMVRRGQGSIINIASTAGLRPQHESLLYSMTKAALIMLTKSYAMELGPGGVRVNAIAPGLIRTVLSEYFWKDAGQGSGFLDRQAIRRIGEPEEIAEVALLLAGGKSGYITGEVVVVDGGFTLG